MRQSVLLTQLEAGQAVVDEQVAALAARLGEAQLAWRPPEGGWGIGQVFEHLTLGNESYVEPFNRLLAGGTPAEGDPQWRPSLLGGLLTRALRKEGNRLPAPKVYQVGPSARPGILAAFAASQRQMAYFRTVMAGLDWRKNRLPSPVTSLIRYNLGDAFSIVVVHAERHLRQVARLEARPDFPR